MAFRCNKSFKKKISVLATVLSIAQILQSGPVFAGLQAADIETRPSGISVEDRVGGAEWETVSDGLSLSGLAHDVIDQISEKMESIWTEATEWANGQLTQSSDTYFDSRTFNSTYDDLWWLKEINAPEAWGLSTGAGVTVAVVDTGVDYNHEDLQGNVWTNSGEIAGNGIDDDNNGLIDDWRGWDFVNSDNDVMDDQGHGTHVSGIIGALKDNGKGISGVAPNAKILGVKVLDQNGSGNFSDIVKGIKYAADMGARIINMSLGAVYDFSIDYIKTNYASYYNAYLKPIKDAILYAAGKGSIVIAASGNSGTDVNRTVPGGFEETLSVGATTPTGGKAYFSNYGPTLDLTAPGWDVLSLRASGTTLGTPVSTGYTRASGTSMATPMVTGVVALLLAQDPTLDIAGIERRLKFSATDLGAAGFDNSFGYGQVDALKAITHDYYEDGTVKTLWLMTPDDAGMVRYDYDADGKIVSAIRADGSKRDYNQSGDQVEYYANGRISSRIDALTGTKYEFRNEDLDGSGLQRVSRKTETDGTVTSYVYWGSTTVVKQLKTEKDGVLVRVQMMDSSGRLTKQTDYDGADKVEQTFYVSGNVNQVSVWKDGLRVSVTRKSDTGITTYQGLYKDGVLESEIFNDALGRLIREKTYTQPSSGSGPADVIQKSYSYWGSTQQVKSVSVSQNNVLVSQEQYDSAGNLIVRVIVEGARKTQTNYYASGNVQQIVVWKDGVKESVTRYYGSGILQYQGDYKDGKLDSEMAYDSQGRLIREKRTESGAQGIPGVSQVTTSYSYWGTTEQIRAVTVQVNGAVQSSDRYDQNGVLVSKLRVEGNVKTQTTYWSNGQPLQVTVWNGSYLVSQTRFYETGIMSYLKLFKDNKTLSLTTYRADGSILRVRNY
ncbi:MAG: S8 family serine peptidase [Candidatus Omnitrophica bacterium]|nr:S8 family serine peptidase [Candidatus Omnitrophota bacterium]